MWPAPASRAPKNRRLLKLMNEPGNKQLVQKMELEHIADRKLPPSKQSFRDIEEDLLFVLDERGHSVHLTDRGVEFMSVPDVGDVPRAHSCQKGRLAGIRWCLSRWRETPPRTALRWTSP